MLPPTPNKGASSKPIGSDDVSIEISSSPSRKTQKTTNTDQTSQLQQTSPTLAQQQRSRSAQEGQAFKQAHNPLQALQMTPMKPMAKENVQEKKQQETMQSKQEGQVFKKAKNPMQALKMTPMYEDAASRALMRGGGFMDREMMNDSFGEPAFDSSLVDVRKAKGKSQQDKGGVDEDEEEPRPRGGAFGDDGAGEEEEYYSANEEDTRPRGGDFGGESWASKPDSLLLSNDLNFGIYGDGDIHNVPLVSKKKSKWGRLRIPGEDEMPVVNNDEKIPEWSRLRILGEDEMPKVNNDEETSKSLLDVNAATGLPYPSVAAPLSTAPMPISTGRDLETLPSQLAHLADPALSKVRRRGAIRRVTCPARTSSLSSASLPGHTNNGKMLW